jgi:hypothetical protein
MFARLVLSSTGNHFQTIFVKITICLHFVKTIKIHQYGYPMKGQVTWHELDWVWTGRAGMGRVRWGWVSQGRVRQGQVGQ